MQDEPEKAAFAVHSIQRRKESLRPRRGPYRARERPEVARSIRPARSPRRAALHGPYGAPPGSEALYVTTNEQRRRKLVIIPVHDDHNGRLKDPNTRAGSGSPQIIAKLEIQGSIPQGQIHLDRPRAQAIRLFLPEQKIQRPGQGLHSPDDRFLSRSINAPHLPETYNRRTQHRTSQTKPFPQSLKVVSGMLHLGHYFYFRDVRVAD